MSHGNLLLDQDDCSGRGGTGLWILAGLSPLDIRIAIFRDEWAAEVLE